jgi:hypothetical protein
VAWCLVKNGDNLAFTFYNKKGNMTTVQNQDFITDIVTAHIDIMKGYDNNENKLQVGG